MGTDSATSSNRSGPYVAGGLFLLWFCGLLAMAIRTTNVAVLNASQIERAELIITGTRVSRDSDRVAVESVWKGRLGSETSELLVDDLARTGATPGEPRIFPLVKSVREDGRFSVAPYGNANRGSNSHHPQGLLTYPATPQLEQELKSLVGPVSE
jgi:hypothetical protein